MSFKIIIKNNTITSYEEFGRQMYLYPEACEKILTSTKFLSILKEESPNKYKKLIKLNHEVRDVNAFLFYAQYIFCEHMELKHHGYSFKNLKELGDKILFFGPSVDVYLKDFLKFKLLSFYMEKQGLDRLKPQIYQNVLELEKKINENENKAYFLLGFLLSECDTIIYEKKAYTDVKDFFSDMITNYHIIRFSSNLETSQYVYAWLEVKGYGQQINNYCSLVDTIEQMEIKL